MTAEALNVSTSCRKCGAPLTIEEMHYYDAGDGTATCNACEAQWLAEVEAWRRGERNEFPRR